MILLINSPLYLSFRQWRGIVSCNNPEKRKKIAFQAEFFGAGVFFQAGRLFRARVVVCGTRLTRGKLVSCHLWLGSPSASFLG